MPTKIVGFFFGFVIILLGAWWIWISCFAQLILPNPVVCLFFCSLLLLFWLLCSFVDFSVLASLKEDQPFQRHRKDIVEIKGNFQQKMNFDLFQLACVVKNSLSSGGVLFVECGVLGWKRYKIWISMDFQ